MQYKYICCVKAMPCSDIKLLLIISCHQTVFSHLSEHSLPVSLNSTRSSKVQERIFILVCDSNYAYVIRNLFNILSILQ